MILMTKLEGVVSCYGAYVNGEIGAGCSPKKIGVGWIIGEPHKIGLTETEVLILTSICFTF